MKPTDRLRASLLRAFNSKFAGGDNAASAAAETVTDILMCFAAAVRGPEPVVGELVAVGADADQTSALILTELRKQNTLLEVIAKKGERQLLDASCDGLLACADCVRQQAG